MSDDKPVTVALLKTLSPLGGMKNDNVGALASKSTLRQLAPGRLLFKEGELDKRTIWLISGLVEIKEGDRIVAMIRGGSPEARNPLCHHQPRTFSARAREPVEYLSIDNDVLDMVITWDQTGIYEVADLRRPGAGAAEDDWMTTLLSSGSFQRIPPANIQAIFTRMQRESRRAGDVIIKQGAEGDYFYAIVSGRVAVTRETPLNRDGIRLAELGVGDSFGEEALITEATRNATVRMLTDGVLVRLAKQDFRELMNDPLVHYVDEAGARQILERGGRWLDVRLPGEFQNLRIADSLNIPLYFIRLKLGTLQPSTPYVVCCDTGRRSAAAAYILVEKGYDAYVLRGGITNAQLPLQRPA